MLQLTAGSLLLLTSFLPRWGSYSSVSAEGRVLGHGDLDGWGSYGFAANLALLLTLSLTVLIAARGAGIDVPLLRRDLTYRLMSFASGALLFLAVVGGPVVDVPGAGEEHGVTRGPLAYGSLVLAALAHLGAWRHARQPPRSTDP